MKKKILTSIFLILIFIYLLTLKSYAVIEADFVNVSGQWKYWKNDKVYIESKEVVGDDNKHYNMVFLSVEFWENLYYFSYYDKENQIFYFDGIDGNEYVKGNDDKYYDVNTYFTLVQNADVSTLVIDDRLYIPISLYRNNDIKWLELGFDEKTNTLYYFGPDFFNNSYKELEIDNVEIIDYIDKWKFFKAPDNDLIEYKYSYKSLEHLKFTKNGVTEYYLAKVNNELTIIEVYYKYDALNKKYVYEKYEKVLDKKLKNNEFVEKIENNYFILKKNDKYGLYDYELNEILDFTYDEIIFVKNKWSYKSIPEKLNELNNKISGNYLRLKKDNKYGIYSLEDEKILFNEEFFTNIDDSFGVKVFEYNEYSDKLEEKEKEEILIFTNDEEKIGIILNNNFIIDPIYTDVELLKIKYTYMMSDDAIGWCDEIVAWKLYVGNEFYILTKFANEDDNFEKINDKIFISKNTYKDINMELVDYNYIVSGIDFENNEKELYKIKREKGYKGGNRNLDISEQRKNILEYRIIQVLCIITIFVIICIVLIIIKYISKKLKNRANK